MIQRLVFILFCLSFVSVNAQDLDWVKPITNDSTSGIVSVRLTPEGNVMALVNSWYYKRVDTTTFYRNQTSLEKYNAAGEKMSHFTLSSAVNNYQNQIYGFDSDSAGNFYITGYFEKEMQLGNKVYQTDTNAYFIAKLNSSFEIIWLRKTLGIYLYDINISPEGKIIVRTYSNVKVVNLEKSYLNELETYEMEYKRNQGFVAFDTDGNLLWGKFYGWDGKESWSSVYNWKVTNTGIYELARWDGKVDVETGPGKTFIENDSLILISWSNFYLAKYSIDGDLLWCRILERDSSRFFGELENIFMDADNEGNIFLSGGFRGKVDFDFTEKEFSINNYDKNRPFLNSYFFGKYDENLNLKWIYSTEADFSSNSFTRRLQVKSTGKNVYLYGIYKPGIGIDFKNKDFTLLGNLNHFFAEYDMEGNLITARNIGESDYNEQYYPLIRQFEVDEHKNIYLAGNFYSSPKFDFDPSDVSVFLPDSFKNQTAFIARYQTCKKPIKIIPQYKTTDCQERLTTLYAQNDHFPVRWYNENGEFLHEGITYTLPQINASTKILAEDGCGYRDEIVIEKQNRWVNIRKIYPNPAKDKLTISIEGVGDEQLNYQLVNSLGQVMQSGNLNIQNGFQNLILPVNGLREGMYFLVLQNQCIRQTEKILISK